MGRRVRAKAEGFCNGSLQRPGSEFTINSERDLASWMEPVDPAPSGPATDGKKGEKAKEQDPAKGSTPRPTDKAVI